MLAAPPDFDNNYFFDVRIGRPGKAGIPPNSSVIWGKRQDYPTDFGNLTNQLLFNSTTYTAAANEIFNVHFIAHHNDDCLKNRRNISIDDIVTLQAKERICFTNPPPTTPWTTTPAPKLCPDLSCFTWNAPPASENSKLVCSFGPFQSPAASGVSWCTKWERKFSWLRHQFDITERGRPELHSNTAREKPLLATVFFNIVCESGGSICRVQNMQAVSKCSVGSSSAGTVLAKALLRTPVITIGACAHYKLTFSLQFSHIPVISYEEMDSYFLEVRIGKGSESRIPDRVIWGSRADYEEGQISMGNNNVTTEFDTAENDSFTLNFVAHHSNGCTIKGQSIAIDDINTMKAEETDCTTTPPPTTPWTTTPAPKLCPDLLCAIWNTPPASESSKLACSFGASQSPAASGVSWCTKWERKFSWLRHQFEITQREAKNMQAVSKCSVGTSSASVQGKAVLRTPVVTVGPCARYKLTFFLQFSRTPVITDNEMENYFLDVRIGNGSESRIPDRIIWGSRADYMELMEGNISMGNYTVTAEFDVAENASFTVNFVAHHSNRCAVKGQSTAIDDITTLKEAEGEICNTVSTTGSEDTTSADGSDETDGTTKDLISTTDAFETSESTADTVVIEETTNLDTDKIRRHSLSELSP